ncbi:Asp23/Gls24 family envelope stress response protein [Desulfolucanica intricata]|uniref:Asp23/Gls24 family envelope stress response protein n=1 Tax=Desulfolucanica intricata TaxID=1285191 RepID=UPI00082BE9CD|nr:Asp23/Gls24 family envelope stress response protein [Desulfolucanica intricata]
MNNENKEIVVENTNNNMGSVRISDEVVKIIAGLAATEVPGVVGMSGGIVGGFAEKLGRKNLSKGVKVEVGEKEAAVDISIIVEYGMQIHDVAVRVQSNVKNAIEAMTGLVVVEVNVGVQGVAFNNSEEKEEESVRVK